MKQILLLTFFFASCKIAAAQDAPCTVAVDSLKGSYEGACEKGKANGQGKAKGADTYEGNFKSGFPDGQGKYTWKNGNYYTGLWKKGVKEGKGEMHYMTRKGDSALIGFWKKDVYKGEYEHPYIIQNVTTDVGRVEVTKIDKGGNEISLTVSSISGAGTTMTSSQISRGQFMSKSNSKLGNSEVTIFRGVIFPFRGSFSFGNTIFEIELFEAGSWQIQVPITRN